MKYNVLAITPDGKEEGFLALTVEHRGPWVYLAGSDYESYLSPYHYKEILVTEDEE